MRVFRTSESDPDGEQKWLRMRKGVADLHRRAQLSQASNERYLEDLASVENTQPLGKSLAAPCRSTTRNGRPVQALNPFRQDDAKLLAAINHGEFLIHGFRNRDIKQKLFGSQARPTRTTVGRRLSAKVTRLLTLLRSHHLIKKVSRSHRYVLTENGRLVVTAILTAQNASKKQLMDVAV